MPSILARLGRLDSYLATPHRERRLLGLIILSGFIIKLVPLLLNPALKLAPTRSEMLRVTIHWAQTGTLADAYYDGSGISSHVGPFNTILAGLVYRLSGVESHMSEFILAAIALTWVSAMIWCFHRALRIAGIAALPCLAASATLAILPLHWGLEAFDFRIREGATAAMLMGALLWWVFALDRSGRLSLRSVLLFGLVAGFAFLIHPVVALGAYAGLGLVGLRYLPVRHWMPAAVLLLVTALVVNSAWIIRSERVYDRFMPSRGNFGLELAVANYPGALHAANDQQAFIDRMYAIHPVMEGQGRADYRTYARDIDYFDAVGQQAQDWIVSNKMEFLRLSIKHARQLFFPPAWFYKKYEDVPIKTMNRIRQIFAWTTGFLGLLALGIGLVQHRRACVIILVTILPQILLYSIMQPTIRYRYMLAPILIYLTAAFLWRLLVRKADTRSDPTPFPLP